MAIVFLIFIILYFIVSYFVTKFLRWFVNINKNDLLIFELRKDLNNLKNEINSIKDISDLKARVSVLEKMKKKGQIDPRIIILIIILVLFLLYLKSTGIFG